MINIDEPYDETEHMEENPTIYSRKAIWGFSILFSPIFGAVLLMEDLKDIGKKKAANTVLILSIVYTIVTYIIVNIPEESISALTIGCNFVGGYALSEHFFKLYIPQGENYPKKKIWKPLIISIIITLPLVLAVIYSLNMED
ncbi:MAG: hypothetical protein P4L34_04805 [Paludibacter sp.]|nr:hypothetical protein [Paludibacter sp.]